MKISSIVDAEGFHLYTGNEKNSKFSSLLALSGNSRVDTPPDISIEPTSRHKWDGANWVEAPISGMKKWLMDIRKSDQTMIPRWLEDHIQDDHGGTTSNATLQQKYDDKKELREDKPV